MLYQKKKATHSLKAAIINLLPLSIDDNIIEVITQTWCTGLIVIGVA